MENKEYIKNIFDDIYKYINHLRKYRTINEPLDFVFYAIEEAEKKYLEEK